MKVYIVSVDVDYNNYVNDSVYANEADAVMRKQKLIYSGDHKDYSINIEEHEVCDTY